MVYMTFWVSFVTYDLEKPAVIKFNTSAKTSNKKTRKKRCVCACVCMYLSHSVRRKKSKITDSSLLVNFTLRNVMIKSCCFNKPQSSYVCKVSASIL